MSLRSCEWEFRTVLDLSLSYICFTDHSFDVVISRRWSGTIIGPRDIIITLLEIQSYVVSSCKVARQHDCVPFVFEILSISLATNLLFLLGLSEVGLIIVEEVQTVLVEALGWSTFSKFFASASTLVFAHLEATYGTSLSVVIKCLESMVRASIRLRYGVQLALLNVAIDL